MKYFKKDLDYSKIRHRIEEDKAQYKGKEWAKMIHVAPNVISNFHKKKDPRNPSYEYIIAVALVTGKPVEWYLYGMPATPGIHEPPDSPYGKPKHTCPFCSDMTDEIKDLCKSMKKIIESKHSAIVPALKSNIEAFEHSVEKERKQDEKIRKLEETVRHHEKLLLSDPATGTGRAAGAGMQKKKT